jgi:plastocyanin
MVSRFPFRGAVAFGTVVSLLLFGLGAAAAIPQPAAATGALTVTVGSALQFTLSTNEVTPGANITLTIVQTDSVEHTFTLSNVSGITFSSNNDTNDLLTFVREHPPLVNITIPSGQDTYVYHFIAPPFGEYAYFCLIPGHFPSMYGLLGSGEPGSGASISTGPGAAVFIIGGTIAGLVVLAIVLGFVVGKRRGSHDEMPPERLGYPEQAPPSPPSPPAH